MRAMIVAVAWCSMMMTGICEATPAERMRVRIRTHLFQVEVVRTPKDWERGLMFRERLAPHEGMLFWGEVTRMQSFWMKNTLISLDLLFLDEKLKIVDIAERAEPLSEKSIPSRVPARHVLEILGGEVQKRNLRVGDQLVVEAVP